MGIVNHDMGGALSGLFDEHDLALPSLTYGIPEKGDPTPEECATIGALSRE